MKRPSAFEYAGASSVEICASQLQFGVDPRPRACVADDDFLELMRLDDAFDAELTPAGIDQVRHSRALASICKMFAQLRPTPVCVTDQGVVQLSVRTVAGQDTAARGCGHCPVLNPVSGSIIIDTRHTDG